MIKVERLGKRFGPLVAVDNLSFEVERGETFALIGPNGAGKTTTLKMLLGLTRPNTGTIALGRDGLTPTDARARRSMGYVPQRVAFAPARTVAEVLSFFAALRGLPRESVMRALERVRMADHAARPARELSGGYVQRLSLGQALLGDPDLLVLDEPTASLDPEAAWEFRSLVESLQREGKTILLCSHLLSEVERVADRVLILVEGRRAALESLDDLHARQADATGLALEVGSPLDDAVRVLRDLGVPAQVVGPSELRLEAVDGRAIEVLEALRRARVEVRTFETERPTLEEIFLKVVRGGRKP
ncbi:MAG TPA: ABC transporter ATP-binding protein [Candidatus Eisenbacteria bacterium]|nr:ABC transporter ATP-binding protein [Candidatus Eisenbacteria bacterium]